MKSKIVSQISRISERIGVLKTLRKEYENKRTIVPKLIKLVDVLIEDQESMKDFLIKLLAELDTYCRNQEEIKKYGTTNWQE